MSGFQVARIAAHLFNTPLLLQPETAVAIASNLAERFGVEAMEDPAPVPEASRFRGKPAGARDDGRPMYRADNGIAIIPVLGELVNRGAWIGASSGLTSYEGFEAQLRAAAEDPSVTAILLDLNSPGGEATGAMEAGALVRATARAKPVVAFVNGMAASAGYAIAAGATKIVTTPTGLTGSIGVVMLHLDRSGQLAKAGVKPTLIHAGAHKVDGSSLQALPDEARGRIQASIDNLYGLFVDHVAALRKLDPDAVRATEGGVLMGAKAVAAGLADKVGTFDDALALLKPKQTLKTGAFSMSTETIAKADHETALRALAEKLGAEHAAALAAAGPAAVAADRQRAQAILGAPEAKGREGLARRLAFATDMTADAAIDTLKEAPLAAAADTGRRPRLAVEDPKLAASVPDPTAATDWAAIGKEIGAL